jgi:hypothetical protein
MADTNYARLVVYLEPAQVSYLKRAANTRNMSVSAVLRTMMSGGELRMLDREDYLRFCVNALLKYHPQGNLIPVVDEGWLSLKAQIQGLPMTHVSYWHALLSEQKSQSCCVLARSWMNSSLGEFADRNCVITSRYAVRHAA